MRKSLAIVGILVFLLVSLAGLNLSMTSHQDGQMVDCPFMLGQNSMCQMPVSNHLSQWQQMFAATPQIAYYLVLLATFVFVFRFLISQFSLAPPASLTLYRYKINHPDSKLFNNLLLAFSDGLLHPKIYA